METKPQPMHSSTVPGQQTSEIGFAQSCGIESPNGEITT